MLQAIRDKATGWIAWFIVILLCVPFALWGIQEYLGGATQVNVAEVNGVEISRDQLNNYVERELRFRKNRPENEALLELKQKILDRMLEEEILSQTADDMGMRIGADQLAMQIQSIDAFTQDGRFDQKVYEQVLLQNQLTMAGFEYQQSRGMLVQQLTNGLLQSEFVTPHELDRLARLQNRELKLDYVIVEKERFAEKIEVTQDQIQAYYESNAQGYMTPEQVKIEYLSLDVAMLEKSISAQESDLKKLYMEQKGLYSVEEQRKASHILIEVSKDADETSKEAAFSKASDVLAKLEAGESFEALAKEFSNDPGSSQLGGDLGIINRGVMDPAFEEATYSLELNQVSEPIQTQFGYHLIKVTEIKPAREKTFDEIREQLKGEYQRQQAEDLFYEQVDQLYDLTYENQDTLEIASEKLGIEIQVSDWFDRTGSKTGLFSDQNLISAVFSDPVLDQQDVKQALNSRPLELQGKQGDRVAPIIVFRVVDHQNPTQQTLEEVQAQIRSTLIDQATETKAKELAEQIVLELKQGDDFQTIAKAHSLEVTEAGFVKREQAKHNRALLEKAFSLPKPVGETPVYSTLGLETGDQAVILVSDMRDQEPEKIEAATRMFLQRFIQNIYGNAETKAYIADVRNSSDIQIFKDKLSSENEN